MSSLINYGMELLKKLNEEFEEHPKIQEIIRLKQGDVERNQNIYNHVVILKDEAFKDRHWDTLFEHMKESEKGSVGLQLGKLDLKKITLNDLLEYHLLSHSGMLKQILMKARAEAVIEQSIKSARDNINKIQIKPTIFDLDNIGLSIIPSIRSIIGRLNDHLTICNHMLSNPEYPEEFSKELKSLSRLVSFTIEVLKIIQKIQSKLIKFSPIFKFKVLSKFVNRNDFLAVFMKVREDFMDIIRLIEQKEMAYFVQLIGMKDHDDSSVEEILRRLTDINKNCDSILIGMKDLFKILRLECPRYYFFTDEHMMMLCSLLKFPKSLFGFVTNLFKGLKSVTLKNLADYSDIENVFMSDMTTYTKEKLVFTTPIFFDLSRNAQMPLISIVSGMEKGINQCVEHSRGEHIIPISKLNFDLMRIYLYAKSNGLLLQNLMLILQLLFDYEVLMMFKTNNMNPSFNIQECLINFRALLKSEMQVFLESPSWFFKAGGFLDKNEIVYFSAFLQVVTHMITTLEFFVSHEVFDFKSFEFQSLPRYSIYLKNPSSSIYQVTSSLAASQGPHLYFQEIVAKCIEETNTVLYGCYKSKKTITGTAQAVQTLLSIPESSVQFSVMHHSLEYKNQLLSQDSHYILYPYIDRILLSFISAINLNKYLLIKGSEFCGKNGLVRSVANYTASNLYEYDCELNKSPSSVEFFIAGVVSGGFWLNFKNLESCPNDLIITISEFVQLLKTSLNKATIERSGTQIKVKPDHIILMTYRSLDSEIQSNWESLPTSFLNSFRVMSLTKPSSSLILNYILSPLMMPHEAESWSRKFVLYSKLFSNVDFNIEIQESDNLNKTNPFLQISLKTLALMVGSTVTKYFQYIDAFYEKLKDPNTGKYRVDINQLKLQFESPKVFTQLMKDTLADYFVKSDVDEYQIVSYMELYKEIFKEELNNTIPLDMPNETMTEKNKEKILHAIADYKDIYMEASIPEPATTMRNIEEILNLLLKAEGGNYLIYGRPDSQKSTLIDLLAFIYSEVHFINFGKFWVNLDAVKNEYLFGGPQFEGIINEIINQTHSIDLEDKAVHSKKISYLFQTSSELYCTLGDPRDHKKVKVVKETHRSDSWIIFDANGGKSNDSMQMKVRRIISMFDTLHEAKEINHYIGLAQNLKVFYELTSIQHLDPRAVINTHKIFLSSPLVELEERIDIWLAHLVKFDEIFRILSGKIEILLKMLVVPFIRKISLDSTSSLYYTSNMSTLNGFLSLFEIFLNEFRKYYLMHELDQLRENISFLELLKSDTVGSPENKNSRHKGQPNNAPQITSQMKFAQQANQVNLIGESRSKAKPNQVEKKNIYQAFNTVEDVFELETRRLEGLVAFGVIYSIYPGHFDIFHEKLNRVFLEIGAHYLKNNKITQSVFGNGILSKMEKLENHLLVTDLCYDFTKGEWVLWTDMHMKIFNDISPAFDNRNFSKNELTRLNCTNVRAFRGEKPSGERDLITFVGLGDKPMIFNAQYRMLNYFIEHMLSYGRNLFVISDNQQGKSLMISAILRKMIEQNKIMLLNFELQLRSDQVIIQKQIEKIMSKEQGNVLSPPKDKSLVVWLDDLHMSVSGCKVESLMRNLQVQKGWFSYKNKNFCKVQHTHFVMTLSYKENNSYASTELFQCINPDILSKTTIVKSRQFSSNELRSIFIDIVKDQISPVGDEGRKLERVVWSFYSQFMNLAIHNKEKLIEVMNVRQGEIGLEKFVTFGSSLNLYYWKQINRDIKNIGIVWLNMLNNFFINDIGLSSVYIDGILKVKLVDEGNDNKNADSPGFQNMRIEILKITESPLKSKSPNKQLISKFDFNEIKSDKKIHNLSRLRSGSYWEADDKPEKTGEVQRKSVLHLRKESLKQNESVEDDGLENINNSSSESDKSSVSSSKQRNMSQMKKSGFSPKKGNDKVDLKGKSRFFVLQKEKSFEKEKSDKSSESKKSWRDVIKEKEAIEEVVRAQSPNFNPVSSPNGIDSEEKGTFGDSLRVRGPQGQMLSRRNSVTSNAGSIRPLSIRPGNSPGESPANSLSSSEDEDSAEYVYDPKKNLPTLKIKEKKLADRDSDKDKSVSGRRSSQSSIGRSHSQGSNKSKMEIESDEDNGEKFVVNESTPASFINTFVQKVFKNYKEIYEACFESVVCKNTYLFDTMIRDINQTEEAEKDYELYQPSFELMDAELGKKTMKFFKDSLQNFIYNNPEALLALKIDRSHFASFLHDYSMIHMNLSTPYQHLLIYSVKASTYARYLVNFICDTLFYNFYYFNIDDDDTGNERNVYKTIIGIIVLHYDKMWLKNKKLIIMLNISRTVHKDTADMIDKVFDLMSSIIFNSDLLLHHIDEQLFSMLQLVRKDSTLYSHLPDFYITYIIRQRLESKITFVVHYEMSQAELVQDKLPIFREESQNTIYKYLYSNYPKLYSRLKRVMINGLIPSTEDSVHFYEPIFKFDDVPESTVFYICSVLEGKYNNAVLNDISLFYAIRPMGESRMFFNYLIQSIERKFDSKGGDTESEAIMKNQKYTNQKITRRIEITKVEITDTETHINNKINDTEKLDETKKELEAKISSVREEKEKYQLKLDKWTKLYLECQAEENTFQKLKLNLKDSREYIQSMREKDFATEIKFGAFFKNQYFTVYAILIHELLQIPITPKIIVNDLRNINVNNVTKEKFSHYSVSFESILANWEGFLRIVSERDFEDIGEESLELLSGIIERSDQFNFTKFNFTQKAVMKWIDLSIETARFSVRRVQRNEDTTNISATIEKITAELSLRTGLLMKFEKTLIELPELRAKVLAKIDFLRRRKVGLEINLDKIVTFEQNLHEVQTMFLKISSPFMANNLNRSTTFQLMAAFILFWSKYPYQIKRMLFFSTLIAMKIDPNIFNEVPIYTLLSKEPLYFNSLNSKIPFNLNLINNIAILQFLHEALFPYAALKDISGSYLKWMQYKFHRFLQIDYLIPTSKTLQEMENCLINGSPYIVVDPKEELIKIIKPLIEWRYKRFCEIILHTNDNIVHHSYDIKFNQKRVVIKESFRLIVIFQNLKIESFDPILLNKMMLLNNEIDEKNIWNETMTEEMVLLLEENNRSKIIKSYIDNHILSKIVNSYSTLSNFISSFDFMIDKIDSEQFEQILTQIDLLKDLAKVYKQTMAMNNKSGDDSPSLGLIPSNNSSMKESRMKDSASFMNRNYFQQITEYNVLCDKYRPLTERIRTYYIASRMMFPYISTQLSLSEDTFFFIVRESLVPFTSAFLREDDREEERSALIPVMENIDNLVYTQIVNSIPHQYRYIYSFLVGSLTHLLKLKNKKKTLKNLNSFLYSEQVINAEGERISFTNKALYNKFNKLSAVVKTHFINISSNMPDNISIEADFKAKMIELRELKENSSNRSEMHDIDIPDNISMYSKHSRFIVPADDDIVKPINLMAFKSPPMESSKSSKISKMNSKLIPKSNFAPKTKPTLPFLHEQNSSPPKPSAVNLFIDQYGNMRDQSRRASKMTIMENSEAAPPKDDIQSIKQSVKESGDLNPHEDQKSKFPGSKLPPHLRKILNPDGGSDSGSRRDSIRTISSNMSVFKSVMSEIIHKSKLPKDQRLGEFLKEFSTYAIKIMHLLFDTDQSEFKELDDLAWGSFLTLSKPTILHVKHIMSAIPVKPEFLPNWDLFSVCTLLKYTRPDLIQHALSSFYASIRNSAYNTIELDTSITGLIHSIKKPIVLLYEKSTSSITKKLERIASQNNVTISRVKFNHESTIDDVQREFDDINQQKTWYIVENIEVVDQFRSHEIVNICISLLLKLKTQNSSKIWILMRWRSMSGMNRIEDSKYPIWLSSCYQIVVRSNQSLKEEMLDLYSTLAHTPTTDPIDKKEPTEKKDPVTDLGLEDGALNQRASNLNTMMQIQSLPVSNVNIQSHSSLTMQDQGSNDHPNTALPVRHQREESLLDLFSKPSSMSSINISDVVMQFDVKDEEMKEFKSKYQKRLEYCIKVFFSMLRQRVHKLDELLDGREVIIGSLPTDENLEIVITGKQAIT